MLSRMGMSFFTTFKKFPCGAGKTAIPIDDILMSGLTLFNLKFPSLLKYDEQRAEIAPTMKNLFGT